MSSVVTAILEYSDAICPHVLRTEVNAVINNDPVDDVQSQNEVLNSQKKTTYMYIS